MARILPAQEEVVDTAAQRLLVTYMEAFDYVEAHPRVKILSQEDDSTNLLQRSREQWLVFNQQVKTEKAHRDAAGLVNDESYFAYLDSLATVIFDLDVMEYQKKSAAANAERRAAWQKMRHCQNELLYYFPFLSLMSPGEVHEWIIAQKKE